MTVTQSSPLRKRPQTLLACASERQEVLLVFPSKHLSWLPFWFPSIKNADIHVVPCPQRPPQPVTPPVPEQLAGCAVATADAVTDEEQSSSDTQAAFQESHRL